MYIYYLLKNVGIRKKIELLDSIKKEFSYPMKNAQEIVFRLHKKEIVRPRFNASRIEFFRSIKKGLNNSFLTRYTRA